MKKKLEKYLTEARGGSIAGANEAAVIVRNCIYILNEIQDKITDIEDALEPISEERMVQEVIEHLHDMYGSMIKARKIFKGGVK